MSEIRVDNITDEAGTGAPDFPQGLKIPTFDLENSVALLNGSVYFNNLQNQLKVYDGNNWLSIGGGDPLGVATFDLLGDDSAVSLHTLNKTSNDLGGLYDGNLSSSATYTGISKFGSHALDPMGDGTYMDIPGLPRFFALSIWYYCVGTDNGYIVDFRHDDTSNGRGYLYTRSGGQNGASQYFDLGDDSTSTNRIGNIYVNGIQHTSGEFQFYDNTWYHIVISVTDTSKTHQNWDQGIRIGNRSDGTSNGNAGYFDQIRTFNRSLTQIDVDKLFAESEIV